MFKKMRVLLLLLLVPMVFACSETKSGDGSTASIIPPAVDNGGNNNNSGDINEVPNEGDKNESIPPAEGNAPDDQTPDATVNNDFSNPINMIGRYKIAGIKIGRAHV